MTSPDARTTDIDAVEDSGPCVRVCKYNERNECYGCFRTNVEVRGWNRMTPIERQDVTLQLARRRDDYWSQFAASASGSVS